MQTALPAWLPHGIAGGVLVPEVPRTGEPLDPKIEAEIRTKIYRLLATLFPRAQSMERRRVQRYPYPHLVRLTPVDGQIAGAARIIVAGKNLSEQGICFYHLQPLAARKAIVSLECGDGAWMSFLTDLTWCRFTKHGWYESGGHFLKPVEDPSY